MVQTGRGHCEELPIRFGRNQTAPRGQYPAEVFRESFVNPEQIAFHRLFVITRGETVRAPIFSIPRMDEFVRYERRAHKVRDRIRQKILARSVIAGFVVLDAEMSDLVTQGQQEVVLAIVSCREQIPRFTNEPSVSAD